MGINMLYPIGIALSVMCVDFTKSGSYINIVNIYACSCVYVLVHVEDKCNCVLELVFGFFFLFGG